MRALKERLQALRGGVVHDPRTPDTADLVRRIERLRSGRGTREERVTDDGELARRLGAQVEAPGLLLLDTRLPRERFHGRLTFSALERPLSQLPGAEGREARDWLFLDTETTGLSGGSGTLAFLVGIARFRAGCLEVRQYLITRFSGEEAMLRRLAGDIAGGETLVSYNGKSFDLPLLATRLRLHRVENPLTDLPHLDLLHPVRRRFARQWDNCRLVTVERNLLGLARSGDLPGSEAPRAWLDYVRRGAWRPLQGVIRHNRLDLMSLAVLLPALERELAQAIAEPRPRRREMPAVSGLRRDWGQLRNLRMALGG
jgi:uncharacterized protein YprB with RNaseH-like and TPR domain